MIRTHEQFIHAVRALAVTRAQAEEHDTLRNTKLVYGIGDGSYRGICVYGAWAQNPESKHALIEIAASGEESPLQLAGTTLHELAHVLTQTGHDSLWKATCARLGLINATVGQAYTPDSFTPDMLAAIQALRIPPDGLPKLSGVVGAPTLKLRPCTAGRGTRGGTSRGRGSGSRLRLFMCACEPPIKARVGHNEFRATCDVCHTSFKRSENARLTGAKGL